LPTASRLNQTTAVARKPRNCGATFQTRLRPGRRQLAYSTILVTTPEPTVRPPSRIAKRTPSSMAIGLCSSTVILTLSPGMHISAPTRLAVPVTSVVRK